jgi:hypothetical protein
MRYLTKLLETRKTTERAKCSHEIPNKIYGDTQKKQRQQSVLMRYLTKLLETRKKTETAKCSHEIPNKIVGDTQKHRESKVIS